MFPKSSRTAQDLWCDTSVVCAPSPVGRDETAPLLCSNPQWVNAGQNKPLSQGPKKKTFSAVDLNLIKEDKLSPKQHNLQRGTLHQIWFYNWPSWLCSPRYLLPGYKPYGGSQSITCSCERISCLPWGPFLVIQTLHRGFDTKCLFSLVQWFSNLWCQDQEQQQQ